MLVAVGVSRLKNRYSTSCFQTLLCLDFYLAAAGLSRLSLRSLVPPPLAAIETGQAGDEGLVFVPETVKIPRAEKT